MEWNYSECGGDSDSDSNGDATPHPMGTSFAEQTELLQVLRQTLELPKGLCAKPQIFAEFFAPEHLWNLLPSETRDELVAKHLPEFPPDCDDALEKEATIQQLFHRKPFRFNSSPLVDFQRNLEEGNYLVDVVEYRAKIAKSERREQRFQECEYVSRMAGKLAASRKFLLDSFNTPLSSPRVAKQEVPTILSESVAVRARKRYLTELAHIMSDAHLPLSDSEEEALPLITSNSQTKLPRRAGRPPTTGPTTATMDMLTETGESKIHGTFSSKPSSSDALETLLKSTQFNEDYLKSVLRRHKKRKTEDPGYRTAHPPPTHEYLMQDLFSDNAVRTFSSKRLAGKSRRAVKSRIHSKPPPEQKELKRDPVPASITHSSVSGSLFPAEPRFTSTSTNIVSKLEPVVKPRLDASSRNNGQPPVAKKLKTSPASHPDVEHVAVNLRGLPEPMAVDIPPPSRNLLSSVRQQHSCFMSLVRCIFCSTPDHRITFDNLQRTVRAWLQNDKGASAWFDDCHSWLDELPCVVKFLVGEFSEQPEDYVPYIEYKAPLQIYQWIGAGRDTDQHLLPLNRFWLEHRHEFERSIVSGTRTTPQLVRSSSSTVTPAEDGLERISPPRSPTTWAVRTERADEVASFRAQEKQRYENPQSPYTYRLHGYESVVGPVTGVYAQGLSKGGNLLAADRPPCVTLTSLVRDAIARLPNGEGTKFHVCDLLKASQYMIPSTTLPVVVNSIVERLQRDVDKCVQFDQRRKLLIYTHRGKSEADFKKPALVKVPLAKAAEDVPRKVISRTVSRSGQQVPLIMTSAPNAITGNPSITVVNRSQPPQNSVFNIRTSKPPVGGAAISPTTTAVMTRIATPAQLTRVAQVTMHAKDMEANLDAKPALIPKLTYNKAPVKVTTMSDAQPLQVAGPSQQTRPLMSLLTNAQGQSVLMHNPRVVKVSPTAPQSVLISSASNPPALVAGTNNKPPLLARASPVGMNAVAAKVVRARPSASPVAPAVTVVPKKTITVNPATIAAVKANCVQKPIQICTTSGNVSVVEKTSPANGSVLRTAATSLLAAHKPAIQNIVIRSASPQTQAMQLKKMMTVGGGVGQGGSVKSMIVTNSGPGEGATTVSGQNVIKIRTSAANQLASQGGASKTITTPGGAQFLQIHPSGAGGQQFVLNSIRQAGGHVPTVSMPNAITVKSTAAGAAVASAVKQGAGVQGAPQLVQLPAKTNMVKGSTVTARLLKTVTSAVPGTVQSRVMATGNQGHQLVTLVDASGKATHGVRIGGKAGGGTTANVIQLAATNGAGGGTQYTVLSSGRSVIQVQQQQQSPKASTDAQGQPKGNVLGTKVVTAGDAAAGGGVKPTIRMVNAANITRMGAGKPLLISNKLPGSMTSLVRAASAATGGAKITAATSGAPTTSLLIGGQTVKVPSNINLNSGSTIVGRSPQGTMQHVMIGNQLVKIQSTGTASSGLERGKSVILNNLGQTYKVQGNNQGKVIKTTVPLVKGAGHLKASPVTAQGTTSNRVVLVQGPQGQLILPSNLQGGSINVKSLKMISVQPQPPRPQPPK